MSYLRQPVIASPVIQQRMEEPQTAVSHVLFVMCEVCVCDCCHMCPQLTKLRKIPKIKEEWVSAPVFVPVSLPGHACGCQTPYNL